LSDLPDLEHTFVIGVAGDATARPFAQLLDGADDAPMPDSPIDEDDLLAILYTSGTTGQPKGATVSQRQAIANLQNIICSGFVSMMQGDAPPEAETSLQSAALLVVPLFHVTGCLATMTLTYATGGKLVLMPVGRFEPDQALEIIEREKVTSFGGVPTIMWRIVESPNLGNYDLSSVKRASYGGAPAAPELVERIEQVFPNLRKTLATAYGLTESASVATAISGDDYFAHSGSVGRPVPTVELRIVDDQGNDVPVGTNGEVWLKGPTMMAHGYWRRPDANEASFTDGWFHTGDIGYLNDEGYLYLVDRAKDMIIRAGENVYCVEVENVLFDHPDVIDAAVFGVPHKELGEEVKAVVQRRPGSTVTVDDIRDFCRKHLADFKVPTYVDIRDEPLPRNPAGKVLKNILRGGDSAFAAGDDQTL
jgi:long-chain acyl-CoA synthetase